MNENLERILSACDRQTLAGQRDYAILCLLIENSLKRQQIVSININDFDIVERSLQVQKRYKRQNQQNQTEIISLSLDTASALQDWLNLIYIPDELEDIQTPLFIALDRVNYGHRLTGTGIYGIVKRIARVAGITEAIAPEQLRTYQNRVNQDLETQNNTLTNTNETQVETYLDIDDSQVRKDKAIALASSQLDTNLPYAFTGFSPDILTSLLTDKRSLNTRRAYEKDLYYFFH
ncbi:MAG: tyrosine-type recombinase/integrase, partial [Pseudanabaena sp. ELA748]